MGIRILKRYFYIQMSGTSELNWKHDTNVDHFSRDILYMVFQWLS